LILSTQICSAVEALVAVSGAPPASALAGAAPFGIAMGTPSSPQASVAAETDDEKERLR
jgi:hypothetical protein